MSVDITFYLFLGLGALFLLVALITLLFPAKKANHIYGYRTDRSMRNRANWNFAQSLVPPMFLRLALYQFVTGGLWYLIPRQAEAIGVAVFLLILVLSLTLEILKSEKKLKRFSRSKKK